MWFGEIARYALVRSENRYAFVWSSSTFPTSDDLIPGVDVQLQEEGIKWFNTSEGACSAAAEAFVALEQQGTCVADLWQAFGL